MSSDLADTTTRILDATCALMESGDSSAVRLADIARHAGLSRQAIYLHFETRADVIIATMRHLDEQGALGPALRGIRHARNGRGRLRKLIRVWRSHMAQAHGVTRALMAMQETDAAAAAAWADRLKMLRDGCRTAITMLDREGELAPGWSVVTATDALCALLSVQGWENLTGPCRWSETDYIARMQLLAERSFTTGPDLQTSATPTT